MERRWSREEKGDKTEKRRGIKHDNLTHDGASDSTKGAFQLSVPRSVERPDIGNVSKIWRVE